MADTRAELGAELRTHRTNAQLSQDILAGLMGWPQAAISRVENGKKAIEPSDVRRWLDHVHAPKDAYTGLLRLAERAETEVIAWREMQSAGWDQHQKKYDELEHDAKTIRVYQNSVMPGLLQTANSTTVILRDVFGVPEDQLGIGVTARQTRQAVLYQPTTSYQVVVTEALLRHRLGGPAIAAEQLHRVATLARLRTVDVRVIPVDTDMTDWYGVSFDLFELDGESVVFIELDTGEVRITKPEEVARYKKRHERLQAAALDKGASLMLIEQIADEITGELFPA